MSQETRIYMIGNAHLDPVWLWQWQEGYAEIKATFRSALDRMKEFPDFIFTCAGAAYYKWVEENAPEMFVEIQQRVEEGRWVVVGGWWIQPDCNIPSGESFARHSLYSQRYYLEKFGVTAKVGYNVDSFGHHGMIPQLLKKSGMDFYVFMRPGEHEKQMDSDLFWWESGDGSRVMTFRIPFSYGNWWKDGDPVEQKTRAVAALAEQHECSYMNFYGVGNHGGGPTIANLQTIHRLQEELGAGKIVLSSPNRYFSEISALQSASIPIHRDDLQHHASGCYSTHAETKANNRRAEHRLLTAEKFVTMAHHLLALPYPGEKLQHGWENVMFNHFHDIMGGCSIKEAYQDAREAYGESLHIASVALNAAVQKISWSINTMREGVTSLSKDKDWVLWEQEDKGIPLVVFNPLSWDIKAPIQVNKNVRGITDDQGTPVCVQTVRGSRTNGSADKWDTLFMGEIPAFGYRVYWMYRDKPQEAEASHLALQTEENVLENDYVRLELEPHTGYIKRLIDKRQGQDVLKGRGAVPVVIDEHDSDTWSHGICKFRNEIGKFADAEIRLLEKGPLRARIRVTNRYNRSVLRQDFILYHDRPEIEVKVKLDWREEHKMLKLSFPVNVEQMKATYEIPYGHIERPANGEEEPGQQWIDVTGLTEGTADQTYGLALVNDSKYSFDVFENDVRMTVVRSPIFADHFGVRDEWCEFMDQGVQEFNYGLVPHAGSWQDAQVVKKAYELNVPPVSIVETYHRGVLPQSFAGIRVSSEQIVVTAFKKAEDGQGYILRCYETSGKEASATIEIPMLERKWSARFGKCEIKTFRIPLSAEQEVQENNFIEL
ncbi:glycosyl hydrolase-related protein [Paenibacillus alginolyticus]|uniref:Glycosyl hydrolase-related protein n=1 Tax=Paenibacillus alginolyticus TaxID=59839 RepID=A0ABT4GPB8_9BACL|nr:alpha-mannosidase [Paenibacillus alginolyticus]MCY9664294.1 glycosyl hydrolase-related protein [Paenibacillus alginolyticus]MCY9698072.1 glycosyl hydrolase-related protein [Paenibacillus alginolyticus]MEC0148196.1 glycoside hydrolase family 38 C-terminal domain-containing protein [Paenibacillus alginolyticus]